MIPTFFKLIFILSRTWSTTSATWRYVKTIVLLIDFAQFLILETHFDLIFFPSGPGPPPPPPGGVGGPPPPPPPAGGVAPPDPSKLTTRGPEAPEAPEAPEVPTPAPPAPAEPTAPPPAPVVEEKAEDEAPAVVKPSAIKKNVAARSISSNVATLRGHKKSEDAKTPAAASGNGGIEYPVLEIYNVGVYTWDSAGKLWETTDSNLFSRLFVVHNPNTGKYRLIAVKQNDEAALALNTSIPGDMVTARQGRFLQFRDAENIYLLAFTSKDDSAIFDGIVLEIKREADTLSGK